MPTYIRVSIPNGRPQPFRLSRRAVRRLSPVAFQSRTGVPSHLDCYLNSIAPEASLGKRLRGTPFGANFASPKCSIFCQNRALPASKAMRGTPLKGSITECLAVELFLFLFTMDVRKTKYILYTIITKC